MSDIEAFAGLLTPADAAKRLGFGIKHLRRLVDRGLIRYIDVGCGRVKIRRMFDPVDLAAYVEQQRRVVVQTPVKGDRRRQRKVVVECPSREGRARHSGTCVSSSKVIAFSELLERAAAARPRR